MPTEVGFLIPCSGLKDMTGPASDWPYPSSIGVPVIRSHSFRTFPARGADPEEETYRLEKSVPAKPG